VARCRGGRVANESSGSGSGAVIRCWRLEFSPQELDHLRCHGSRGQKFVFCERPTGPRAPAGADVLRPGRASEFFPQDVKSFATGGRNAAAAGGWFRSDTEAWAVGSGPLPEPPEGSTGRGSAYKCCRWDSPVTRRFYRVAAWRAAGRQGCRRP